MKRGDTCWGRRGRGGKSRDSRDKSHGGEEDDDVSFFLAFLLSGRAVRCIMMPEPRGQYQAAARWLLLMVLGWAAAGLPLRAVPPSRPDHRWCHRAAGFERKTAKTLASRQIFSIFFLLV